MRFVLTAACLFGALATQLSATVITFEGFAPPGGLVNVNPGAPYFEAGFTLTATDGNSAVFDAAASSIFPGDPTSWFGFASDDTITLTGPTVFSLDSVLLGPSSLGSGTVDFTVTGFIDGGGTVSTTFSGLTTATYEAIGFANLDSAQFTATSDSGIDDIQLNTPEPGSVLLVVGGFAGIAAILRRRRLFQA
jgi:PEP-CTERM motif